MAAQYDDPDAGNAAKRACTACPLATRVLSSVTATDTAGWLALGLPGLVPSATQAPREASMTAAATAIRTGAGDAARRTGTATRGRSRTTAFVALQNPQTTNSSSGSILGSAPPHWVQLHACGTGIQTG